MVIFIDLPAETCTWLHMDNRPQLDFFVAYLGALPNEFWKRHHFKFSLEKETTGNEGVNKATCSTSRDAAKSNTLAYCSYCFLPGYCTPSLQTDKLKIGSWFGSDRPARLWNSGFWCSVILGYTQGIGWHRLPPRVPLENLVAMESIPGAGYSL